MDSFAIQLYKEEMVTLEKAAKIAGLSIESFTKKLGELKIAAVRYSPSDVSQEVKDFE